MNQTLLKYAIDYLADRNHIKVRRYDLDTFRALMNITMPIDLKEEYYHAQDEILQERLKEKDIVDISSLKPLKKNLYLYLGDITLLKADGIVNAANPYLLGCFTPLHKCIDNAIHSFGGLQIRRDLIHIMKDKKIEENGKATLTLAYNLPSKYILHTVGPRITNKITPKDEKELYSCYLSCLEKAIENDMKSIAFPAISTGIYGFDKERACQIALKVCKDYLLSNDTQLKIVFNLFSKGDYDIYVREIEGMNL